MLDINITQGEYWGGAQINYWFYVFLTVFPLTAFLGFDHMALRSPMTAVMKFLSIIPLLGFWYFYDIAQLLGERKLVEKNGLAVPFYGPIGLGAGIFSGSDGIKDAPSNTPSPWIYMAYALTTCIFIALPVNKFVIGDYWAGISQVLMYICIFTLITPFLAIAWGFYDIYKVLFNTRDIIEQGPERFIPATWFMDSRFKRDVLGPSSSLSQGSEGIFNTVASVLVKVPNAVADAASTIVKTASNAAVQPIKAAAATATSTVTAAGEVSKAVSGTAQQGAEAVGKLGSLLDKLPQIADQAADKLGPGELMAAAKITKGGAMLLEGPAISSIFLVFGVGLAAFTGFVFYFMRKTYTRQEKSDDPPSESATV